MSSITGPLKRHSAIAGCASVVFAAFATTIIYCIGAYTIPEAWQDAVFSRDWLTFAGIIFCALLLILWVTAPAVATGVDAAETAAFAAECDRHTIEDDGLTYDGKTPGALWRHMDSGPRGPGVYRQVGKNMQFVRSFTPAEAEERELQNSGTFGGYADRWKE